MSHFYARIKGTRGEATRCGDKHNGITADVGSWHGGIRVFMYQRDDGIDCVKVYLMPWQGRGITRPLYDGPVDMTPVPELEALTGADRPETGRGDRQP